MINKIKVYKNIDGSIIEINSKSIVDAYKTSDGNIFLSELDAYKYEVDYLSNTKAEKIFIGHQETFKNIDKINEVPIPKNVKQYTLSELFANSCETITEASGIYMWVNIYEKLPYCGSANNLRERVKSFVNSKNDSYSGKKINEIRKKYIDVHNLAWKLFILEENIKSDKLLEKEKFYISKYDSIARGYNTANPVGQKKEDKIKKYQMELVKSGYNGFLGRAKDWGAIVKVSLNEYGEKYVINEKYPSFRLTCFMNNKNTIEKDDLAQFPRRIIDLIDVGRKSFRNENDTFPTSLIRYRTYDNAYIPLCNNEKTFKTANEAITHQIKNYREKVLNALIGEDNKKYYNFIEEISDENFIELMFHDAERLKFFISKNVNEIDNSNYTISKDIKKYYYETIDEIKKFGLEISDNLTLENYNNFFQGHSSYRYNDGPYPSFRLLSYINNKKTVGVEELAYLPYGICKHIDRLKEWSFITTVDGERLPNFFKYKHHEKKYTVIGLAGLWYDTPQEALIKYLEKMMESFRYLLKQPSLSSFYNNKFIYDDKLVEIVNSMDYDTLINLMFENPEEIIKLIKS